MMHAAFRQLIANQYEASLCTLMHCAEECPDSHWNVLVARYPFSQVIFHTLFFADYYLGNDAESFRLQTFHTENRDLFSDYEQLKDQEPKSVYSREQIEMYGKFCRDKASATIAEEAEQTLCSEACFARRNFSRAELHVYNIRHIQHHAPQLILRLRIDTKVDIPWIDNGWREPTDES
ncbi:hypothetical protein [Novipirellula rosea]|uniref:DinB superfamily protein n=1 Tax=Novipirellula rosea TaxID=1031540 RepID=A0ABP8M6E1_9BACT